MGMAVRGQPPVMLPLGPTTRATEHGQALEVPSWSTPGPAWLPLLDEQAQFLDSTPTAARE